MIRKCKICKLEFTCKPSSKQKYCSLTCCHNDPEYKRNQSEKAKKRVLNTPDEIRKKISDAAAAAHHQRKLERNVKVKHDVLDITYKDLEEYREKQKVCEICGKENSAMYKSRAKLCVDHDHNTNKFRGLLCYQCNRALGWFENNQESVLNYLTQHSSSV